MFYYLFSQFFKIIIFKGQSALIDELERLKCENSALEKANLKLESENLNCNLKLENEKADTQYLINKIERLQETAKEGVSFNFNFFSQ